jgi:PAT family beta-lactamase induction signal transducer AmpG
MATLPYSWKFVLSPFINNIIIKYADAKFDIIKVLSLLFHAIIIVCFASIGGYSDSGSLIALNLTILAVSVAVAANDIVFSYVKLLLFKKEELGPVVSIINSGFRIGIFLSGAVMLYIAEAKGWRVAFTVISLITLACSVAALILPRTRYSDEHQKQTTSSVKDYLRSLRDFFSRKKVGLFLMTMLSFKFTDSCISTMKPVFLQSIGMSKITFANVTHVIGLFVMIISGLIAGACAQKFSTIKCMRYTFIMQCIPALLFTIVSCVHVELLVLAIVINISTIIFSFSNVVFRTYAAEESSGDVNIFVLIISLSSLYRIISTKLGGMIADVGSWPMMFMMCLVSNIPGLIAYRRILKAHSSQGR